RDFHVTGVQTCALPISQLVAEVLALVRELAESGMTMIIATHEMSFAREVADKVCFLDAGVIAEEGPPDQIFSAPQQARTREFLEIGRASCRERVWSGGG